MKFPLWLKLVFIMVFIMSMTLIASGYFAHRSFERGFLGYLNQLQGERLDTLKTTLISDYEEQQNWEFLHNKKKRWDNYLNIDKDRPAKARTRRGDKKPSPRRRNFSRQDRELALIYRSLSLLDQNEEYVVGHRAKNTGRSLTTPLVFNGETIGYLNFQPFAEVTEAIDKSFAAELKNNLLLIGLLGLAFTLIASWMASRFFHKPILRLTQSAREMALGNYSQRIQVKRKDELGQLAHSFNRLASTLDKNQHARQQWIADISHELRTPLAVLQGELEALEDGVRPVTPHAISSLSGEVDQLKKLVNDLYELSLSDLGALNYQLVKGDANTILESAFSSFQQRFENANLDASLKTDSRDSVILVDDMRFTQLLSNLLENSVRYTDPDGQLKITTSNDANHWIMELDDSAPGIPTDQIGDLFERFYRVEASRGRKTGGAGLGLAIVSEIVTAHNGEITASASNLGGLKIHLKIPLSKI